MKTKYFKLQELVHPFFYEKFGDKAWEFLNPNILVVADAIREEINSSIVINNWNAGGDLKNCGLRPFNTNTGAEFSIHKFGGALDLHFTRYTPTVVFGMIMAKKQYFYDLGLRRIENVEHTPTWLHIDCANTQLDTIHVFRV